VAVFADDEMVVHGDAERPCDLDDRLRHLDVGARGSRIAGGMVVQERTVRTNTVMLLDFLCRIG